MSAPARLSDADALAMYAGLSIHELGRRAMDRCQQLHPEPYRTYVVDRNINYSNVCTARCTFCNFYRQPGSPAAYVLTHGEIGQKIEELLAIGGTQVLMQGGLVPDEAHPSGQGLSFDWYLDLLRFIKRHYPTIHVHAFSPPEIWAPMKKMPCTVPRSLAGIQRAKVLVTQGHAPASPMPNKNRVTSSEP